MRWTDEQARAIGARGESLLLSAAAGSGKTTVLVERVLRLILDDGADIDRMLVVTFTRAAASDMRAKLSERMNALAAEGDARCRDQLIRLERASITTLHAFCADFLRAHFEVAGVDPAFRVLDDAARQQLMDEALDEALEDAYAQPAEALRALDYGRGPKDVRALAESLCRALEERPEPEQWLARAVSPDGMIPEWMAELVRAAHRAIDEASVALREAAAVPGCPPHYLSAVQADLSSLAKMREIDEYDPLLRAIQDFKPARASGGRRGEVTDEEAVEAVKALRDRAKSALKGVKMLDHPAAQAIADARAQAPQLAELGRLAANASERFEQKKAERAGLTYADLERRTLIALRDEETSRAVREQFDYVFVDEYQDTSDIQEAIVSRVARPDNLFMVGDVKQSIYRFRMAEPRLFIEKYARFRAGDGGQLLPLTRNFRSKPAVLEFVNAIFERAMTGGDAEIEYDALARLNPGLDASDPGQSVEIHLLERAAQEGEAVDETVAEMRAAEREGLFIARRIRQMMREDPTLRYRDFAILTRSKASAFTPMLPMLLAEGLPAYADGAAGYFDAPEIALALAMLKLIANRRSDVELIAVLHSPAVGLSAEELAQIRIGARNVPFVDAAWKRAYGVTLADSERPPSEAEGGEMESGEAKPGAAGDVLSNGDNPSSDATKDVFSNEDDPASGLAEEILSEGDDSPSSSPVLPDDELARRLRRFFDQLESWRLRAGAVGLGELVRAVLDESGFYIYAGALPGGAQRQANLDRLADAADAFDADVSGSLVRFLSHTERLRARGDGDAAHLLGENDDVVRMMTVHKSKGLEFRVVFGAQLEKGYGGARAVLLSAHRDLGIGIHHFDPELRTKRRTLAQSAIAARRSREDAAEELRILYVLLTRARERLILVGSVRGAERAGRRWNALSRAVFASNSHLDVLMAARAAILRDGADPHSTVTLHPAGELSAESPGRPDPRARFDEILAEPDRFDGAALEAEMRWQYPDPLGSARPLKLTVSGLLRELEGPSQLPDLPERPQFMAEEAPGRMTAAERGTAYHRAMQLIDLRALDGLDGRSLADAIRARLDEAVSRRLMTEAQREAVRPSRLAEFLQSPVGQRLRRAETVKREWPFNALVRADEALSPAEAGRFAGEELLVQGTIDCCFIEDGAWILLDYKTDRSGDLDALRAHYRAQLSVYALALERITGIPVRQRLLCLLASNAVLEV